MFTAGHDHRPRFIQPVAHEQRLGERIISRRYDYPQEGELLERHLVPLFEAAGVQLVVNGHSHVYSRYTHHGISYVESSNLGNTYGWHDAVAATAHCERALCSNDESYVTLVWTRNGRGEARTICAQDGREVDAFAL